MSLNATPSSDRLHIGIFGRRNAGKSSIINAITSQDIAIVSDIKGTTTDPVYKAMEMLPLGPIVIMDTPGIDDEGELGKLRMQKSYQVLNKTDIAVLVIDGVIGIDDCDRAIIERFKATNINYVIAFNRMDLVDAGKISEVEDALWVSAKTGENITRLKEAIIAQAPTGNSGRHIVGDLISQGDFVVLVIPIDEAAPKGRLILPQQQTIREILDSNATSIIVKDTDLSELLLKLGQKPRLVITDSQAFEKVSADTPDDIPLTSFSILFSRYKGNLEQAVRGAITLQTLQEGETILISEGCTHHRQCGDIGTVKLPAWIKKFTGKDFNFKFTSGTSFPDDLKKYSLIIHCGGCMLNEREMKYRLQCADDKGVPMTNYGIVIAHTNGILKRAIEPFSELSNLIKE